MKAVRWMISLEEDDRVCLSCSWFIKTSQIQINILTSEASVSVARLSVRLCCLLIKQILRENNKIFTCRLRKAHVKVSMQLLPLRLSLHLFFSSSVYSEVSVYSVTTVFIYQFSLSSEDIFHYSSEGRCLLVTQRRDSHQMRMLWVRVMIKESWWVFLTITGSAPCEVKQINQTD